MKNIVFDTSTIISITTNNLLHILSPLKERFGGDFTLPKAVKAEIIDKPLTSKKFKLEAIQIIAEVLKGNLRLVEEPKEETHRTLQLANSIFIAHDNYIQIMHLGEAAVLTQAKTSGADAIAVDERTTRLMIEEPMSVARILGREMRTEIKINRNNMAAFKDYTNGMEVIRSVELGIAAYDLGLLDEYIDPKSMKIASIMPKRDVLDGLLWGLKLRGCSITPEEIDEIMHLKGH